MSGDPVARAGEHALSRVWTSRASKPFVFADDTKHRRSYHIALLLLGFLRPAIYPIGSTFLRGHGVEIREHVLGRPALALGTMRVRPGVLGDAFAAFENSAAFRASEFIGRHSKFLQARTLRGDGPVHPPCAPGAVAVYADRPEVTAPAKPVQRSAPAFGASAAAPAGI